MKAESNMPPVLPYDIEFRGDEAHITFFENVVEAAPDGETPRYTYDIYTMTVRNRPTLIDSLEANIGAWIAAARDAEYANLAAAARAKRDELISATDFLVATDYPLAPDELQAVQEYRQALRDVPQQGGFPYDIVWPEMGEGDGL